MPLTYRHATPADLPFIVRLVVDGIIVPTEDDPADAMNADYVNALAAIDRDPNQEMFVVAFEGRPIGCFQLSYIPGLMRRGMTRGQIELVHIEAAYRNRGFGTEMMRWPSRAAVKRAAAWCSSPRTRSAPTRTASTTASASSRATRGSSYFCSRGSQDLSIAPSRTSTSPGIP